MIDNFLFFFVEDFCFSLQNVFHILLSSCLDSDSFALSLLEQFMAAITTAAASQARHEMDSRLFVEAVLNNNVDGVNLLLQKDRNLVSTSQGNVGC